MISELSKVSMPRQTDDWSTPKYLFDSLNNEFHFTLDACSSHENCLCDKHYTLEEDGLKQNWGGRDRVL